MHRTKLMSGLLAATVLTPIGAYAQSTAASDAPAQTPEVQGATLEEVVVTAERREESLTKVPIAITAVSGKQLEAAGVSSTTQLSSVVPGLNFTVQGAYAQPTIRGIGTTVTGAGADANVSVYVDGVYQPSQAGNVFTLSDIDQIEVLKGPQGTLFGRNATGGAISITTKAPSFDPYAMVDLGYGSFQQEKAGGYATGGLTDDIAADISLDYSHDTGYMRNITLNRNVGGQESLDLRSKILYNVSDDLSFTLAGGIMKNRDDAIYLTKPIDGNNTSLRTNPGLVFPSDPYEINTDTRTEDYASDNFANLTGKYHTQWGTFTSITAYQSLNAILWLDSDVTSLPLSSSLTTLPEHNFSQEANFSSDLSGPINFLGGVYYYHDKTTRYSPSWKGVDGPIIQDYSVSVLTNAYAVYGQVYYDILDDLRLTGGFRYSEEEKKADGAYTVGPATQLHSKHSWGAFTPSASLRWNIDKDSSAYASFSRGFKSGSYNTTTLAQSDPVDPEFVTAYEVGYKKSASNLIFNTSAFYYDYQDIQVAVQTNINGVNTGVLQNAATARIWGFDGDVTALIDDNWQARLGAAYTHARYVDFPGALVTTPIPGGGNTQTPMDASGNVMVRAPAFQGSGTLSYNHPLFTGRIDASATVSYNSGFYWDAGNRLSQDAYTLLNANVSWMTGDDAWRFQFWTTNLTDTKYYYYVSTSTTGNSGSLQRPRAFGVLVSRYF